MSLSTISAVNGQTRQARTGRACGGTGRRAGVRPGTAARAREMPVGDRQTATAAVLLPVEQHQARRVVAGARLQRTLVSRAPVGRGDVTKDRVLVADAARARRSVPGVLLVSVATVMIGHVRVVHGVKVRRSVPGVLLVSVATVMIGHVRVAHGVKVRRSVPGVLLVSVATVTIGHVNETVKRSKSDGASRPVWSRRRMNRNCPQAMTRPGSPARCGPSFVGSTSHWQAGWGATCVPSANWSIAIRNSHCGMPSWPAGWRPGYPWFAR